MPPGKGTQTIKCEPFGLIREFYQWKQSLIVKTLSMKLKD
jgi:hypothetical protein